MTLRRLASAMVLTATIASSLLATPAPAAAQAAAPTHPAERLVGEVLDGIGLPWGSVVNSWDLRDAADRLQVELREPRVPRGVARRLGLDADELWREIFVRMAADDLVVAQRQQLRGPSIALGLDPGASVDESDVRRLAEHLGLDIGEVVSPTDVHNVDLVARSQARIPTDVMARVDGLELRVPGREVRAIGFHEAPRGERRLPMQPVTGMVMPSRGRPTKATSAVDVAMPAGSEVLSPVDGIVTEVVNYSLYNRYADTYLRIRGAAKDVVVLHVEGVKVGVGSRVEAGLTPIARGPRVFPFDSQVEQFAGKLPHVDVTVRDRK